MMPWTRGTGWIVGCGLLLAAGLATAEVKTSALFGSHMVLQQGRDLPVWGTAEPGETVTVTVGGDAASATAGPDGAWRIALKPLTADAMPRSLMIEGHTNRLVYTNVLVGEVWFCAGQSNMGIPVKSALNGSNEVASATQSGIRIFAVRHALSDTPRADILGEWRVVSPESVAEFSAIGYFFGRDIHQAVGVPVGLIAASWGGTRAEAWTSRQALLEQEALAPMMAEWDAIYSNKVVAAALFHQQMKTWEAGQAQAGTNAYTVPKPVWVEPATLSDYPASLYNGMIAPLIPYAIRGVLWYQGENNYRQPEQYATLFPTLIQDWRTRWGQGDFPFLFVQLAGFARQDWSRIREAQTRALSLPNTGMAVAIDVGERLDVHPKNKQAVGQRLAALARHEVYGQTEVACYGPTYASMKVEGSRVRLFFHHAEGGLVSNATGDLPFVIAGQDLVFVPAQSKVEGDQVVVWSDAVAAPVAVRYAWTGFVSTGFLYNQASLPMPPFRTDDPMTTP